MLQVDKFWFSINKNSLIIRHIQRWVMLFWEEAVKLEKLSSPLQLQGAINKEKLKCIQ